MSKHNRERRSIKKLMRMGVPLTYLHKVRISRGGKKKLAGQ